jgi:hypothetical protein
MRGIQLLLLGLITCCFAPSNALAQTKKPPPRKLSDLVDPPRKLGEFPPLPRLDDAKLKAQGLRKLVGKHLTLVTDVAEPEIDELTTIFDQAVPQWAKYFDVEIAKTESWQIVGYLLKDKDQATKFADAGCLPADLPPFLNGYQKGAEFWLYDQPTYYRRHLLLHEGTHAYMAHFLGGGGPPWFSEGMAELLATHSWKNSKLLLNIMPAHKNDVPFWGRVKIVQLELAANRGMMPIDIMKYSNHAHLKTEPYGWSWAAAYFFDRHPLTNKAFRELNKNVSNRSLDFSRDFYNQLLPQWPAIQQDWQLFTTEIDYGYDLPRAIVLHTPAGEPLPAAGKKCKIAADRGWQSSGVAVEAGKTYRLTAGGRYQVAQQPQPWECEPNGITLRYYQGQPLGMLLAAVSDPRDSTGSLLKWQGVGSKTEFQAEKAGTLYFRVNENPAGLSDNAGHVAVEVEPK